MLHCVYTFSPWQHSLHNQQQQLQTQSVRGKAYQQKGSSATTTSAKTTSYSHVVPTATTSSSVVEHERRDQHPSKSRRTANPPPPPPVESILPLPTPHTAPQNLAMVLDNQSHSAIQARLDGQPRKTKKTTSGYKRNTGPVAVGPKSLPQNARSEPVSFMYSLLSCLSMSFHVLS